MFKYFNNSNNFNLKDINKVNLNNNYLLEVFILNTYL